MDNPGGGYRIAADVGGTFTDIALLTRDDRIASRKVRSTPADYAAAVVDGILALLGETGVRPDEIEEVLHGCTVATNAILESRGARTALITTRGFRDVLELRRIRMPRLYDPLWQKPRPLVPRHLRLEVSERLGADGAVVTPLDETDVDAAIEVLRREQVEAVAIAYLHAYADPRHEQRTGALVRAALPRCFVTLSSEVLPEIREYERTSTTVINAYVGPPVRHYIGSLLERLAAAGISGRLLVMQSSGGVLDAQSVMRTPVNIVECGPAAGVIGAVRFAEISGRPNLITLDMGGTTAKASLVENLAILRTDEYEVGGGISLSSRLVKGGGYALKTPVIDISEVGAGGGSVVWLDQGGQLKVGPHSAGAEPGPACYGLGGREPTLTDANVVLGYLNPEGIAGGSVAIDRERAWRAIEERIAGPLGRPVLEAAFGAHVVANATMIRAVKTVTTYRGRDPRDFTLLAFGGNGGINGIELARALQIGTVVIPGAAGIFSAVGLLFCDIGLTRSRALVRSLERVSATELQTVVAALEAEIAATLGVPPSAVRFERSADLRYAGQAFELTVALPEPPTSGGFSAATLAEAFEREHERTYGHRFPGARAVEMVSLRVTGALPGDARERAERARPAALAGSLAERWRQAYFGPEHGLVDTPVIGRGALAVAPRRGPLIIEEYDSTVVVPPGCRAGLDPRGNIEVAIETLSPGTA
jgi:N-methylhydantoinase A